MRLTKKYMWRGFFSTLFIFFSFVNSVDAQHYTTPFGQNRIQYKNFDWYYYSTTNFDIYYYPGGQEYALEAVDFLEDEFINLTDQLGYAPYSKTKIFIYNSIHDLQQSNVGIDGAVYTIGGRTDFVKLQLEVAYPGQASTFKENLIYQLSSTLINDMMYGGSLAEIFQNSYLLSLPNWFIDGAARYIAYGWSREMDDYLRDYMSRKRVKKLKRIDGESASIVGQSIWNYIAVKYGKGNISNILNLTRIIRKEENSIANTLGVSFKTFLDDWQNYYLLQREEVTANYVAVDEDRLLEDIRNSKELIKSTITFNKNADKVAYAMLKNGKYQIYVTDLQTGRKHKITTGGYRINGQAVDEELPLLDWQDDVTLGAILFRRGFLYLNTYNLENGDKGQKPLTRFRQIESFSFNDNGRLAVISGDIDGQNDVFLVAMNRNALRRITRDKFDDLDPIFIPGTAAIVFSSNRTSDSVRVRNTNFQMVDDNFNLYVYDLDTTTSTFYRLTNSYGEDRKPYPKSRQEIYYLSDRQGISNLYRYSLYDSITTQITNFDKSIISYDLHFNPNRLTFIMLDEGEHRVFYDTITNLTSSKFTLETPRRRRKNALQVVTRILKNEQQTEPEPVPEKDITDTDDFVFEEEPQEGDTAQVEEDPNWIDTDNYIFADESETSFEPESFFSKYQSFEQENERVGPIPYRPRFAFNNLITSFLWDPYRNFMMLVETEINDVLENYKIKAGGLIKTNLQQGDVYGEFQYLKYWMDFRLRFDRKTYLIEDQSFDNNLLHKYKLGRIMATAALPLTHTFRIEASPFYTQTTFTNLNYLSVTNQATDQAQNSSQSYMGGTFAMIFDNAIEKSFNLYQGTRASFEITSHIHTKDQSRNFSSLRLDVRHYQKIHKEITFATRLFYGKQMGPARKTFMLGGMNNWLFADAQVSGPDDPLAITNQRDNSDLLFNEFVTNLRGLDFNEANGSDALVINAELRVPLFQYLVNGPIKSNFLRNFQVIGFADMGSAWTGSPPFSNGQSITQRFVGNNPWSAEIVKFQNPWLGGFGFGLRTVLLGYYIKFDAAKPYIDGQVGNYRYYFTLGLDF